MCLKGHIYWLSDDLIVCVQLTMFTNQIPMCLCVWVGQIQLLAANHVQCTFFFRTNVFMHV